MIREKKEFLRTLLSQSTTISSLIINLKNKSWELPRFLKSGVGAVGGGGSSGRLFN